MIDDSDEGEMLGEIIGAVNGFLSKMTRRKSMRALDEKAARGWYPSLAPVGYINVNIGTEDTPERIIKINEEQAPYLRQIPHLYNQGYGYAEIAIQLHNQGLRSLRGNKVSHNEIRKILFSDFYLGEFEWRGKRYKGNHTPLFEFFEVQKARQRSKEKGHLHPTEKFRDKFIFKRLNFHCGECLECKVTAELKIKHYKKRTAEYILYHCSKSRGGWKTCRQGIINQDDLIIQFAEKVVKPIAVDEELAEFMLEEMDHEFSNKKEEQEKLSIAINRRLGQLDTELKNLFEMRMRGQIYSMGDKSADEVYEGYRMEKENERKRLVISKEKLLQSNGDWKKKASNFFLMLNDAVNRFLNAAQEKQFNFLNKVTSNLLLLDKNIIVTHKFPFSELQKCPLIY